jgi:cytochrome P450 family 110
MSRRLEAQGPSAGSAGRLPPGPLLFAPLAFARDACGYYARCARRFGDPFTLRTQFGALVITGHPEGLRAMFTAPPDRLAVFAGKVVEPFLGPTSLMLTSGERHRRDRQLVMPPFHGARTAAYSDLILEHTRRAIAGWRPATPLVAQREMQHLTLGIILELLFGEGAGDRFAALRGDLERSQEVLHPLVVFLVPLRRDLGLGPWGRFRRAVARVDAAIYAAIAERRASGAPGDDVLGLLLAARFAGGGELSDGEVRDQVVSLIAAGHETLASALAWALYWLHREPETLSRLAAEVDALGDAPSPEAIAALPYLQAVCSETLRLNPVAPEATRLLLQPLEFMGYRLPAGVAVGSVATLVHMRPELYPEPEAFRPERFLERRYTAFEFIPFGGGAHRCIGAGLAMHEMKLVLATLLRRCRFRLAAGGPARASRKSIIYGPGTTVVLHYDGPRRTA